MKVTSGHWENGYWAGPGWPASGPPEQDKPQRVLGDIRRLGKQLGRPPVSADDRTLAAQAKRHHGSWANAVEAAGYPRPSRATRRQQTLQKAPVKEPVAVVLLDISIRFLTELRELLQARDG